MRQPELALALVGFGHVGRRFVRLLDELADRLEFQWRLVAIATRRHGHIIDPDGIDARRAIAAAQSGHALGRAPGAPARDGAGLQVIDEVARTLAADARQGALVVIETTVLDIERGEPATSHARAALEGRAHFVTANKGPAAFAYDELETLAASVDRLFLFEGAVMDGIPVFNLVRETMPGVNVEGFRGIINTTCQYALSEMERGATFDEAVAEMQARGIAEADPSHDVDGWDAAAKTAALVNVLIGGAITPHQVSRTGIRDVSGADLAEAAARGRRVRLVASASCRDGRLEARVEPELLDVHDPLAGLGALENALYLRTDVLGELGIVQRTSSLTQTAYALLADLTQVSRHGQAPPTAPRDRSPSRLPDR